MTEGTGTASMTTWLGRDRFVQLAEGLAVAVVVVLPWSTSATSILVAIWLLVLVPTLDVPSLRRILMTPAGILPVTLWGLGVVGMLWSDAAWADKVDAIRGFHRLLLIPLLLLQFGRTDTGIRVVTAFLVSCTALLALSWTLMLWPEQASSLWPSGGIPFKDYLVQSGEFLLCAFALAHWALDEWRLGRKGLSLALTGLALAFLANIAFVATGRSTVLIFGALVIVFGLQRFGWRGALGVVVGSAILAAVAWGTSPYLRGRVLAVADEISRYVTDNAETSSGLRLEFWKKSMEFIAAAPVIGHGTGSVHGLFRGAATGERGTTAAVTGNPHNMTLEIAIQLGLLGVVVLYAMWAAHLMLFRRRALAAWIGFGLVVQDIIASLFLSHLLDFTTGWIYVFGVGVLGGMVLRAEQRELETTRPL
jgi:O-antigen ligase